MPVDVIASATFNHDDVVVITLEFAPLDKVKDVAVSGSATFNPDAVVVKTDVFAPLAKVN